MHPSPLPPGTPIGFTVPDALTRGITPRRLRAKDLSSPFHGMRARRRLVGAETVSLLLAALPPHAFVCGTTAACLWGLPLAAQQEAEAWTRPRIGVPPAETRIRREGVLGHRLAVEGDDVVRRRGLAVLSPARTWVDVSRVMRLPRFLALTDALLSARHPLVSAEELARHHERFAGGRGARVRQRALELADGRAESPRESMVRLILIEAGLPRPECNVEIWHHRRFVARVDMLYADEWLVIEYDGDHHRDPDQWSRDQIRRAELESLGYRMIVVTRRDFDDPDALVRRIRRLLTAAR
jgi:hypothetical protein